MFFYVLKYRSEFGFYFKNVEAVGLRPVDDLTVFIQRQWRYGKRR